MKTILILVSVLFLFGINTNAQVAVIVNKSVLEKSITSNHLSEIYTSKVKTWEGGVKIMRFFLKSDEVSSKFFGAIGKSLLEMNKIWMKSQLTGEGQSPQGCGSDDEIIDKVASTPGAIGFVSADKVNAKVKVLLTIN